jgi:hypothetical protein
MREGNKNTGLGKGPRDRYMQPYRIKQNDHGGWSSPWSLEINSYNLTSDRRAPRRHNRPASSGYCVDFVNSIDEIAHRLRLPFP